MLELSPCFDAEQDILQFIISRRKQRGLDEEVDPELRIIGQEQDGLLIYTWIERSPVLNELVSCVGIYDNINKNKVIFEHEKLTTIINATVSQEHTFLGFVTVEQVVMSDTYGKKNKQDVYKAFLAEVQPQNRVFYLNLERQSYIKLNFLYGYYKGQMGNRESHLIVMLHKESIGLYHIPVARMGEKTVIMSGEPKKEQIFHKRFVWSQLDASSQRLHVVHFRKQGKTPNGQSLYKPIFTTYQFNVNTVNEFMIEIALDLPIPHSKSPQRAFYTDLGPSSHIPDASINMEVLMQPNGTMCICYQHCVINQKTKAELAADLASGTNQSCVQYSIIMVHHGKVLHCQGPKLPSKKVEKSRIVFGILNDYVVAILPGRFTHLLNVGIEYEPCLHILWQDPNCFIHSTNSSTGPSKLVPFITEKGTLGGQPGLSVYDPVGQCAFKVTINWATMVDLFANSTSLTTRLSIMHYAAVRLRDLSAVRRLFEIVALTPVCNTVAVLMSEYLIGSSYAALKRQLDRNLMKCVKFTSSESFVGLTDKADDGQILTHISYSALGYVTQTETLARAEWGEDIWENIQRHLQVEKNYERFFSSHLLTVELPSNVQFQDDSELKQTTALPGANFFHRIGAKAKTALTAPKASVKSTNPLPSSSRKLHRTPSKVELILGQSPSYLVVEMDAPKMDLQTKKLIEKITYAFGCHLLKFIKGSKTKIFAVASEFAKCLWSQGNLLGHIIWSVMGCKEADLKTSLNTAASKSDKDVFMMFERFFLALQELDCPLPPGFSGYLTALGFRCLGTSIMMQYLDAGVLKVSQEFALRILSDLGNDEESVDIKLDILSHLTQSEAIYCLKMWDHPESARILVQNYAAACLLEDVTTNWPLGSPVVNFSGYGKEQVSTSESNASGVSFPPLETFTKLLNYKDPLLAKGHRGLNAEFIRKACLGNLENS